MLYRIGLVVFAICMIILGKSNLVHFLLSKPDDAVTCIEDIVINGLQPVTNFYISNNGFGTFLLTLMILVVDL
jgi:hypothetical protein